MQQHGISFLGILGLIFITLKLLSIPPVADWSWWIVLLPLYGGLALFAVIAFIAIAVGIVFSLGEKARKNSRKY